MVHTHAGIDLDPTTLTSIRALIDALEKLLPHEGWLVLRRDKSSDT
jgi:hypothetical protein